ncbi:MAG: sulfotransferase family protein [Gammaproteobacteria bacterium]
MKKTLFVVLGMPRSGTSAITRGLKALGVNLGDQLVPPGKKWNATGYWEDNDIVFRVNKKILHAIFDTWESIKIIQPAEFETTPIKEIRASAINLIKQRLSSSEQWGFKDPRTVRLLPFWRSVFAELNVNDNYLIALRNPLASAHSLHNLTGIDMEKGLLLWLAHLIPAIDETRGKKRMVVNYNSMLENPHFQLERMRKHLDINTDVSSREIEQYAKDFLDKKMQHYEYTFEDLKSHPAAKVVPLCLRTYELLTKLANDELHFNDAEFITGWNKIKEDYEAIYPTYCYIDDVLRDNKLIERTLRSIRRSIPWKLIYPLRIIDDQIRKIRRRSTLRRRLEKA